MKGAAHWHLGGGMSLKPRAYYSKQSSKSDAYIPKHGPRLSLNDRGNDGQPNGPDTSQDRGPVII